MPRLTHLCTSIERSILIGNRNGWTGFGKGIENTCQSAIVVNGRLAEGLYNGGNLAWGDVFYRCCDLVERGGPGTEFARSKLGRVTPEDAQVNLLLFVGESVVNALYDCLPVVAKLATPGIPLSYGRGFRRLRIHDGWHEQQCENQYRETLGKLSCNGFLLKC